MNQTIYYYKFYGTDGEIHNRFSNGVILPDNNRACSYIWHLRDSNVKVTKLYLDNKEDFKMICEQFGIDPDTPWEDIFYSETNSKTC